MQKRSFKMMLYEEKISGERSKDHWSSVFQIVAIPLRFLTPLGRGSLHLLVPPPCTAVTVGTVPPTT